MDLTGRTFAHYEIGALVGRGGMGEVYRARDTRLERDVAVKVLPRAMSGDPERIARFDREARTLAALNHPNIAQIYGIEEIDGTRLLVMEFVEGVDLAERLHHGPVPLDEALEIACAICAGLEEAHRGGIVHRDLKPANVKITPTGAVKILDFGLARALAGEEVGESDPAMSPTITAAMTEAGTILGSAAYMSPEQARGRRVDKRTDLWSFGVLFFEMLSGQRMFDGGTTSDTIAAVLRADIDLKRLPASVPVHVRRVLARCLERDLDARQRDAGDVRLDLLAGPVGDAHVGGATRGPGRGVVFAVVAVGLFVGVAVGWFLRPGSETKGDDWRAFVVDGAHFVDPGSTVISPDGRRIIYGQESPEGALMVLDLDGSGPRPLPGTEGARGPFFSPDGEHVAFFDEVGLHRIRIEGGRPRRLSSRSGMISSGYWAPNDTLYVTTAQFGMPQASGVVAVSADGTHEHVVTVPDVDGGTAGHIILDGFPDGRHGIVSFIPSAGSGYELHAVDLWTGEVEPLGFSGLAQWSTTGHLLVASVDHDALLAVPFSETSRRATGEPIHLIDGIGMPAVSDFGLDVSGEGTLIHGSASLGSATETQRTVVLVRPGGEVETILADTGPWMQPRLDPARRRLVIRRVVAPDCDLWSFDLATGSSVRMTFAGDDHDPLFLPDGRLAYVERLDDGQGIKIFDRIPGPERLLARFETAGIAITDATPDGRRLFLDVSGGSGSETGIHLIDVDPPAGDGVTPEPWRVSDAHDQGARVSPDGRWVAHTSRVSGRENVVLRRYDDVDTAIQVSNDGGRAPRWSPDGSALYFQRGKHVLTCDVIVEGDGLQLSPIREFVDVESAGLMPEVYEPTPDGLLMLTRPREEGATTQLTVLIGLGARLRELAGR